MKLFHYNRIVTSIALASYLLASTLSGILHDHGDGIGCCDIATKDCASQSHETCPHHHHHSHSHGKAADRSHPAHSPVIAGSTGGHGPSAHNTDCAACQFLSQLSVPVALVSSTPSSDTPSLFMWVPAEMLSADILHAFDARGPPATA